MPPADPYAVRTPDDIQLNWTLANLQNLVTRAEVNGGWLPLNLHHVCATNCPAESITPTTRDLFRSFDLDSPRPPRYYEFAAVAHRR